jgi:hypothetical protein
MISIRNATPADLPGILQVEQSWPEGSRAGADKFLSRLARFPQGFFLASIPDPERENAEIVVATMTAMPLNYRPDDLHDFENWNRVTNQGYLYETDLFACNALYIVSGVIDARYRGLNLFTPAVLRETALAQSLGLRYVLAGAVIPGYRKFCERHGELSAFDYCVTRRGKHLVDPLLALYDAIGFSVPNAHHVLPEYYPDDASRNFAALVVRDLRQKPIE